MAYINQQHVFAAYLGVMVDGVVVDGSIVDANSDTGVVTYHTRDQGIHTSDRLTLTGVVRFFPASPYIDIADLAAEFPELSGALVPNPQPFSPSEF